jgi:hypothetical protein
VLLRRAAAMDGGGGDAVDGEASGARFEWDEDSQLYYHASTGFYHDPVAGWYYSGRDGQYYIYDNGNYVPWTPDAVSGTSAGFANFICLSLALQFL